MNVMSLGFQTDLALLERAGSSIEDHGDHLVVRTAQNPSFYWGNFILLDHVPAADEIDNWLVRFQTALPEARHRSFGLDLPDGTVDDLSGFAAHGLKVEASTVMTASSVHPPARPNSEADYRTLTSDDDWLQSIELQIRCYGSDQPIGHREFVTRRIESNRSLVARGYGQWFGAFIDGVLTAQLGLVLAGDRVARFQTVETDPDYRNRGLAGTLAHTAACYGLTNLGAQKLVIVADPEYLAIRIYRGIGFADSETQVQAERPPPDAHRA
jgi:ribosomal protein S18 acetylase RimI-like enzyme